MIILDFRNAAPIEVTIVLEPRDANVNRQMQNESSVGFWKLTIVLDFARLWPWALGLNTLVGPLGPGLALGPWQALGPGLCPLALGLGLCRALGPVCMFLSVFVFVVAFCLCVWDYVCGCLCCVAAARAVMNESTDAIKRLFLMS